MRIGRQGGGEAKVGAGQSGTRGRLRKTAGHRKLARGVSEDSPALRPDERGDVKLNSVWEREESIRQEVHNNRETFVWERELTSDVAWATDGQGGAVGQGVGDLGKWFRAKKRGECGEVRQLDQDACAS